MEKIKQFIESEKGKDILIVFIVILVGLGSFELGRLSKEGISSGIKIEYANQTSNQPKDVVKTPITPKTQNSSLSTNTKNFFASNRGNKYYPVGCSAGKTIKLENRIYFANAKEAEGAGYELSGSCN